PSYTHSRDHLSFPTRRSSDLDRYLDEDLWADTDGQAVALEHKAVLEDNGFRVGTLGGITPVKFQELITSDRSCVNPQEKKLHARSEEHTSELQSQSNLVCRLL